MPNHIKNRIELIGPAESIDALIITHSTKEQEYTQFPDFEKVAFELRPDRKKNYELIDGIYQYKDEE